MSRREQLACETVLLRDGTPIAIRGVAPSDRAGLRALFDRLSPLSVRHRYFAAVREPDLRWLDDMGPGDVGLVAVLHDRIIGSGRYATVAPHVAEVAFEVGDVDQHRGIGTLLLERLAQIARATDVTTFRADVASDNAAMLDVFERCGFEVHERADRDGHHVEFPIEETKRFIRASAERHRLASSCTPHQDDDRPRVDRV